MPGPAHPSAPFPAALPPLSILGPDDLAPPALLAAHAPLPVRRLDRQAIASLAAGLAMAAFVAAMPGLTFIFSYLGIALHELGHAAFGWLFGYPSIPAFDFRYGGGMTMHREQSMAVLAAPCALAVWASWRYRRNRLTLCVLGSAVLAHCLLACTAAHQVVVLFMGHGTEIAIAGLFLYRAASGSGILRGVERPLYAFCGLFLLITNGHFAWRLATSRGERILYGAAKGGGHWMDFSRIAEQHLRVDLTAVAAFYGLCCLAVPVASFLALRYQGHLRQALRRLGRRAETERGERGIS